MTNYLNIFIQFCLFFSVVKQCACYFGPEESIVSDEEYYEMPDLIEMDNYERCLSRSDSVFCTGMFEIEPPENHSHVYDTIQKVSSSILHFNHSRFFRGTCLGPRTLCPVTVHANDSHASAFEDCIRKDIRRAYGLETRLMELINCRMKGDVPTFDTYDWLFLIYAVGIITLNVVATVYDCLLSDRLTGNRWLLCFSLKYNWERMTTGAPADPRYSRFKCFNGLKAILASVVILAHVAIVYILSSANPRFVELLMNSPDVGFMTNGTVIIQTFIVMSNLIQVFKILLESERRQPGVGTVINAVVDRFVRMAPMYLTMVAYTATLSVHSGDGPLWARVVQREAAQCRRTWWRHVALLQHWAAPVCVPQAWYLSLDFQLFVLMTCVVVGALRAGGQARLPRTLLALLGASCALLYAVVYTMGLKSAILANTPEAILHLYERDKSFLWLYQSVWGNAPSAIMGALAAYFYYKALQTKQDYGKYVWVKWGLILSPGLYLAYSTLSCASIVGMESDVIISLHATLDKPIFSMLFVSFIYGCFFEVDHIFRKIMESRALVPISKLSLSMLLVHGAVCKYMPSIRHFPGTASRFTMVSDWLAVTTMTILLSLPLSLMIEMPFVALYKNFSKGSQMVTKKNEQNNNVVDSIKEKNR